MMKFQAFSVLVWVAAAAAALSGVHGGSVHGNPPASAFLSPAAASELQEAASAVKARAAKNCPYHPKPVEIPPKTITKLQGVYNEFEKTLQSALNATSTPGISAQLWYRGKPLFASNLGYADKSTKRAPTSDTIFRIGSVSKVFATIMLYQFADQQLLTLDEPVEKAVPSFKVVNPFDSSKITWAQLASQMSGLQREAPVPADNTEEVLKELSDTALIWPPGKQPSYSNLAFALIGRLLAEKVANTSFEEYVQTHILEPLGMKNTGFNVSSVANHMAVGYNRDGSVASLVNLGWSAPAGQMYSTTNDLNTLAAALINDTNPILSPQATRRLRQPVFLNPSGDTLFGTPWEMLFDESYLMLRKGGNINGFAALFSMVPDLDLSLSVVFNGGADEFGVAKSFAATVLQPFSDALVPLQPSPVVPPGPSPEDYTGTYVDFNAGGYGQVLFNFTGHGALILVTGAPLHIGLYLRYVHDDVFQYYWPEEQATCIQEELMAIANEYVFFTRNEQQQVTSFASPGVYPGFNFTKVA